MIRSKKEPFFDAIKDSCISYLYISVMKHHDQGKLQNVGFIFIYSSRSLKVTRKT